MIYTFRLSFLLFAAMLCGSFVPRTHHNMEAKGKVETFFASPAWAQQDKQAIAALLASNTPVTWLFTGNSITQGAKHTHGHRGYPEIFSERVRFEMGRSRDIVVNTAISGHTTQDILADFEWRVAKLQPKVVILMIGTNDAAITKQISVTQYAENLTRLLSRIRDIGAIPILLSPTPIITTFAPERSSLGLYATTMEELAEEKQVIFVNNWEIWKSDLETKYNGQVFRQLLNDPLHPNGLGHKEIAMSLFRELNIFDPAQPTGGAPYYEGEH